MDISVTSVTTAYQPQQAGVRSNGGDAHEYSGAYRGKRQTDDARAEVSAAALDARKVRDEVARGKEVASGASRSPGFSFEFQEQHRVMKVHNVKGVLIYQVPSKGQLSLIEAEGNAQRIDSPLRLTA